MVKTRNKHKTSKCEYCRQEFKHYNWNKQRYCSRKCCSLRYKEKVVCDVCKKVHHVSLSLYKRNSKFYCSRSCYCLRHGITKRVKRATKFYDNLLSSSQCECGVSKKYLLQVHHIDGNRKNNEMNNIEIVCASCHVKRHLRLDKKGQWVYHPRSLTPREILKNL